MGRLIVDISPSVDGYIAGPGVDRAQPFGDAGHRLHRWLGLEAAEPSPEDREASERVFAGAGAVLLGRTMFDVGIGTWGPGGAFGLPSFVVTHRPGPDLVRGPTRFTFVTDGVKAAVEMVRAAAGDRDVIVVGGAEVVQQCLSLGVVDELRLHIAPVLLGAGTRLFGRSDRLELTRTRGVITTQATHLTFERY